MPYLFLPKPTRQLTQHPNCPPKPQRPWHPAIPGLLGGQEGLPLGSFAQDGRMQRGLLAQVHEVVDHLPQAGRRGRHARSPSSWTPHVRPHPPGHKCSKPDARPGVLPRFRTAVAAGLVLLHGHRRVRGAGATVGGSGRRGLWLQPLLFRAVHLHRVRFQRLDRRGQLRGGWGLGFEPRALSLEVSGCSIHLLMWVISGGPTLT